MITCITFDDICLGYLPFHKFKKFVDCLQNLAVTSTLFVVPFRNGNSSGDESDAYVDCLRKVSSSGHEIAQHGHSHTGNPYFGEFGNLLPLSQPRYQLQKQLIETGAEEIRRMVGTKPKSFRAPFYLHNSNTLKALHNAGFQFDSSKTFFKPAHLSKIRLRTMRSLKPFRVEGILEIPVAGDYTYKLTSTRFEKTMEKALSSYEYVKSKGGVFVINNHPNVVDIDLLFAFLKAFVARVSEESDFIRLIDVGSSLS